MRREKRQTRRRERRGEFLLSRDEGTLITTRWRWRKEEEEEEGRRRGKEEGKKKDFCAESSDGHLSRDAKILKTR